MHSQFLSWIGSEIEDRKESIKKLKAELETLLACKEKYEFNHPKEDENTIVDFKIRIDSVGSGRMIEAIKVLRNFTTPACGLRDAKYCVDGTEALQASATQKNLKELQRGLHALSCVFSIMPRD